MSHHESQSAASSGAPGASRPRALAPVRPPEARPHLLFIVLDDVGFSDLGCYGSESDAHMDRLAAAASGHQLSHHGCARRRPAAHRRNSTPSAWAASPSGPRGSRLPGTVTKRAATLAEILRPGATIVSPSGSGTSCHLRGTPPVLRSLPLGRARRWYGFHGASPISVPRALRGQHPSTPPSGQGYHLSETSSIGHRYIRDQQSVAPDKPSSLLALAPATGPTMHPSVHREVRGRYDCVGCIREQRLARQKALGIVRRSRAGPLTPTRPGVTCRPMAAPQRRLMEV